jgi:hypothetical protein
LFEGQLNFIILVLFSGMASSGTLRRVAFVRTEVSEELRVSIIRVTRIGELGTTLAVTIATSQKTPFLNMGMSVTIEASPW